MDREIVLLRHQDGAPPTAITLARKSTVIGRDPTCDIVVSDVSVSRRHAQLYLAETKLIVRDLLSKNGTFVDGERIDECIVQCGQQIRFADVLFVVVATQTDMRSIDPELETQSVDNPACPLVGPITVRLSAAEQRVFDLLLKGATEKRIARRLAISQHTVHNHVRRIYAALEVHSRPELLARYLSQRATLG